YWHGAPDLVIEVLSPSTAARDRGVKFDHYETAGVREYWLIDPMGLFVEVYTLKDGTFERAGLYERGVSFQSAVLGKAVPVDVLLA
ncbi:MAG: Uma2 family endonuclease, partial [Chloroflexota bacterium]